MSTFSNTVTAGENAIVGVADAGIGVHGTSNASTGTGGESGSGIGVHGVSTSVTATAKPGVRGDADAGVGVFGASRKSTGVAGHSDSGVGVHGTSAAGDGVFGDGGPSGRGIVGVSVHHTGVEGATTGGMAVFGSATPAPGQPDTGRGVVGLAVANTGVEGRSTAGAGVWGQSDQGRGVVGIATTGAGVWAESTAGEAIHGETHSSGLPAVTGIQLNEQSTGAGVYGEHRGDGPAGFFRGNLIVTGYVQFAGADCAECFDIVNAGTAVDPGTVMVIEAENALRASDVAYDRRVAGVISGAGDFRAALLLDHRDGQNARQPVALMGKVFCKVDASYCPVDIGDLLTTSSTVGHAMKATDPARAFGAVIGKALRPLRQGRDLIPILVTLQ